MKKCKSLHCIHAEEYYMDLEPESQTGNDQINVIDETWMCTVWLSGLLLSFYSFFLTLFTADCAVVGWRPGLSTNGNDHRLQLSLEWK